MDAIERAARGGRERDQRVQRLSRETVARWQTRAERLEQLGLEMIETAKEKSTVDALKAGLQLLDAADKVWARVARVAPLKAEAGGEPERGAAPTLESYRQRRTG